VGKAVASSESCLFLGQKEVITSISETKLEKNRKKVEKSFVSPRKSSTFAPANAKKAVERFLKKRLLGGKTP